MSKRKIEEVEAEAESFETTLEKALTAYEQSEKNEVFHEYKVSNFGRVESKRGIRSFGFISPCGYFRTESLAKGKSKKMFVHRLVAMAFIGHCPTDAHDTVDHKNNNRGDNRVENLCWETRSNQVKNSYDRNVNRDNGATARSKQVQSRINANEPWGEIFSSMAEAAKKSSSPKGGISAAVKKGNRSGGFYWRFVPKVPEIIEGEQWKTFVCSEHNFARKSFTGYWNARNPQKSNILQVSSLGRIKNGRGLISHGTEVAGGYREISYLGIIYSIHDLVARLFIGPPPSFDHTVNHKDLNPGNNAVTNLEWASKSEQTRHSLQTNLNRRSNSLAVSKKILGRKLGEVEWKSYESIHRASITFNLDNSTIVKCCKGLVKHTGGYEFKYAPDPTQLDLPGEIWKTVKIKSC